MPGTVGFWEKPSTACRLQTPGRVLTWQRGETGGKPSPVSNPFPEDATLMTSLLPEAPPANTITLGVRTSAQELVGDTHILS